MGSAVRVWGKVGVTSRATGMACEGCGTCRRQRN